MSDFYIHKTNYHNKTITFIYHTQTKTWYLPRNELIEIIFNPKSSSTYWRHLKIKYLKQNINIDKYTKTIKVISKDNKKHPKKLITLNNSIKLIKKIYIENKTDIINYLQELNKSLITIENEIDLKRIIDTYTKLGYNKKEIHAIFFKLLQ